MAKNEEIREMKPISIMAAKQIAVDYGYDQVIIIARRVGQTKNGAPIEGPSGEHVTTYGVDKDHCAVAEKAGDFLKHKVMGWHEETKT